VVKVLDFGLAKAATGAAAPPELSESHAGVSLGSASSNSPEQARGHSVDKRGDLWAFGCVLYEMLTGRLAFPGETSSDRIARILEREPDWSALPATTPRALRRILLRCLAKDPKQRLRDIGDVRIEINVADEEPPANTGARTAWRRWVAVLGLVVGIGMWTVSRPAVVAETALAGAPFTRCK
jgi:serine/threonine protein kinase